MTVPVRTLLLELGFKDGEHTGAKSDALCFAFGAFDLTATRGTNRWLRDVWSLGGIANDGRSAALIEFEMPLEVYSREQGIAWIAEHVAEWARSADAPQWLQDGFGWRDELPWRKAALAYECRPRCQVARDWFRLPNKTLRLAALEAGPEVHAHVSFDGEVLKVTLPYGLVAVPASGDAWPSPVTVRLASLRHLPQRLADPSLEVAVHGGHLLIGRLRVPVLEEDVIVNPSKSVGETNAGL